MVYKLIKTYFFYEITTILGGKILMIWRLFCVDNIIIFQNFLR